MDDGRGDFWLLVFISGFNEIMVELLVIGDNGMVYNKFLLEKLPHYQLLGIKFVAFLKKATRNNEIRARHMTFCQAFIYLT